MKKLALLFSVLAFSILGFGCGKKTIPLQESKPAISQSEIAPASQDPVGVYTNQKFNFAVQYPEDWRRMDAGFGTLVMFFSPEESDFQANMNIVVEDLPEEFKDITIEEYAGKALEQLGQVFESVEATEPTPIEIEEKSAVELVYSVTENEESLKIKQALLRIEDAVYIFTYTAPNEEFEASMKAFDEMIQSFEVKK